jgi:SAM-dependent methyltransferase
VNPLRWAKAEVLHFAWKRGRYMPPDRRLFVEEILPALAREPGTDRILSVGVSWYTTGYPAAFPGKVFATIDIDPTRAEHAGARHAVGDVRELAGHFPENEPFDLVLMNGVIGYGLDAPKAVDEGLRAVASRLRPGGTLVLGVNEEKPTHVDPASVAAFALFESRPLGRWSQGKVMVPVPFRERTHTFLFWRRR